MTGYDVTGTDKTKQVLITDKNSLKKSIKDNQHLVSVVFFCSVKLKTVWTYQVLSVLVTSNQVK